MRRPVVVGEGALTPEFLPQIEHGLVIWSRFLFRAAGQAEGDVLRFLAAARDIGGDPFQEFRHQIGRHGQPYQPAFESHPAIPSISTTEIPASISSGQPRSQFSWLHRQPEHLFTFHLHAFARTLAGNQESHGGMRC
ncbi:hypothetical protein [Niveispirillum sp. SYP-B3756]|uniref:hypothetical protein n=1 Tax=Niveispirillum sp. SYP-B3756 TaxID=2662178 RepID=UPI00156367BC|nr:hypothetical protein [Niveispirillum sp. SYP-B3756]